LSLPHVKVWRNTEDVTSSDSLRLALSVRQPWAELIIAGRKTIELRTWTTDRRGPLWLHAGLKRGPELECRFGLTDLFHGGFIGRIRLSSIVRLDPDHWERWRGRHMAEGPVPDKIYGWVITKPERLAHPIPARGGLGLFAPRPEVPAILREAQMLI
jgi:hypothetical protein